MKLRVGAVAYLNTRPLCLGFDQGIAADRIDLSYDVPSALARRMAAGDLEVALLPSIELARIPGLTVIPGLSISSLGPARSVLLVAKKPLERVERVALDPESRTSNALAQVLFAEAWGGRPSYAPAPVEIEAALEDYDAVVRIGDKALFEAPPRGTEVHDLGEAWRRATGLPFVFAVWAALPATVDRALYRAFHASRREGHRQLRWIADDYSWRGRRDPETAYRYLTEAMRYRLGGPEVAALRRFHAAAARLGLVERAPLVPIAYFSDAACAQAAARRAGAAASSPRG